MLFFGDFGLFMIVYSEFFFYLNVYQTSKSIRSSLDLYNLHFVGWSSAEAIPTPATNYLLESTE